MIPTARLVSLVLLATLIVILGVTFYKVVASFMMPLFLAAVVAMLAHPIYQRILARLRNRKVLAAGLTTALFLAALLILSSGTVIAARQLYRVAQDQKSADSIQFRSLLFKPIKYFHLAEIYHDWMGEPASPESPENDAADAAAIDEEFEQALRQGASAIAQRTIGSAGLTLVGSVVSAFVGLLMFVVALFYFLADGPTLLAAADELIPVHRDYKQKLLIQFEQAVRAVVSATFVAAIGQGIATGIGMKIAGSQHFVLVTVLATMTSMIPMLGAWLVWGPFALWLFDQGHWGWGIALALYGIFFVGLLDNVLRTYVLQGNARLHPLLALVSVLGGIEALGLWGVFIGPVIASCLHALVRIFNAELVAFSRERQPDSGSGSGQAAAES
jgi:predicted PurR-regulated permease PerM